MKELVDAGFITHDQSRQHFGTKYTTTNTYEICWMKKLTKLKALSHVAGV